MSEDKDNLGCEGPSVRMVKPRYTPNKPVLTWEGQGGQGEAIGWLPRWAFDRLTGELGSVSDPVTWGIHAPIMSEECPHHVAIYAAQPAPVPAPVWEVTDELVLKVTEHYYGPLLTGRAYQEQIRKFLKVYHEVLPFCQQPAPVASVAGPEDIEAIIACLGDDAATLRDESPEIADNLDAAAEALRKLTQQPAPAVPAELSDEEVVAALEVAGVRFQRFMGGISGTKDCWNTSGSQDVRKIANGVRALLSAAPKPAGKDGV